MKTKLYFSGGRGGGRGGGGRFGDRDRSPPRRRSRSPPRYDSYRRSRSRSR